MLSILLSSYMTLLPEQHVKINSLCQIYLKILLSNLEKNTTMPEETDRKHTLQLFFFFLMNKILYAICLKTEIGLMSVILR